MVETCLPMQGMHVQSLDCVDPLEKDMETHSSILAWRIPWIEEPGGLQSTGSQRDMISNRAYTYDLLTFIDLNKFSSCSPGVALDHNLKIR